MNQYKPCTKYRKTIQQILKGGVLYSVTCWWFGWCSKPRKNLPVMSRMLYQLSYRTMYRGHIALSLLLSTVTFSTVTINPIVHVNRLIILKHFIISFCLLKHYITTLCCCQVVFLMIMLYKPYQLKHLNFPTLLFTHYAFTEIAHCTSGRTTTTTKPDIDSMKFVTYV